MRTVGWEAIGGRERAKRKKSGRFLRRNASARQARLADNSGAGKIDNASLAVDTLAVRRVLRLMKPPRLFTVLSIAVMGLFAGCQTPEPVQEPQRTLVFPQPVAAPGGGSTGKWKSVPRDGGSEYAQVLCGMEDVVSFYGFYSDLAAHIRTFDEMEGFMRSDNSFGF